MVGPRRTPFFFFLFVPILFFACEEMLVMIFAKQYSMRYISIEYGQVIFRQRSCDNSCRWKQAWMRSRKQPARTWTLALQARSSLRTLAARLLWLADEQCMPSSFTAARKGVVTLADSLCLLGIKPRFRVHTTAIALHARRRWNYVLQALPSSLLRRHNARIVYLYLWLQYQGKSDRR